MAVLESVFAIERKELTKERPIASGGFGEVYVQKKEFSSLALLLGSFFFITCTRCFLFVIVCFSRFNLLFFDFFLLFQVVVPVGNDECGRQVSPQ